MQDFKLVSSVLILVLLSACAGGARQTGPQLTDSASATAAISAPAGTITPSPADQPAPTRVGSSTAPATIPIASASSQPLSTPFPPGELPIIAPANTARLEPLSRLYFSPWELVLSLAWSPDGATLAVSAGETIHLYAAADLGEIRLIQAGGWQTSLAFNPDSRLLASGGRDGRLRLWDVTSGVELLELEAHPKGINSLAFSPDGRLLASGGNDAVARLWDPNSGEKLGELIGGTFAVPAIAFTPDGASLAIVNGAVIRLRDVESQRFVATIRTQQPIYSIAISPHRDFLASGSIENSVQLWQTVPPGGASVEIRESLINFNGHTGESERASALVWSVVFNPDGGILASAGGDSTVRLWDTHTGVLLATLAGHTKAATCVAFSPDGRMLVSGGLDGALIVWAVTPE